MTRDIRSESLKLLSVLVGGRFRTCFFVDLVEGISLEVILHHFV